MNKEKFLQRLQEKTGRSENECFLINAILEENNIIGRKNKEKIKQEFMARLNLNEADADTLYNQCAETIMKGIFRK